MDIKITPYDCISDVVDKALRRAITKTKRYSVAFVGDIDTIQLILSILLKNIDRTIDKIDMDICEDNIYQLTMDEDGFISVVPIRNKYGDYLIVDADIRYISDEVPLSYCGRLNACGEGYSVFGFDYDDNADDIENEYTDEQESDDGKLSNKASEDLFNNAEFTVVYGRYNELPEATQQLIDLTLDWGFCW